MKLRDYQQDIIDELINHEEDNVCVVMPTGAGKTVTICHYLVSLNCNVIILAHRNEILEQFKKTLRVLKYNERRFILATINSFYKHHEAIMRGHRNGVLVVDEAHRIGGHSYSIVAAVAPVYGLRLIGLTATPIRGDGQPLGGVFDILLNGPSYDELQEAGHLVKYTKVLSTPHPMNLSHITVTAGDYQVRQAGAYLSKERHRASVVDTWIKSAANRPTLVFCCTIEHCEVIAEEFRNHGVIVEVITGKTKLYTRLNHIERLRKRQLSVIITCLVFIEGIDIPEVSCVVIDRPTKLLGLFIQMVGRGARPAENKHDCYLIDHCGLCHVFGPPLSSNIVWSLTEKPEIAELNPAFCRKCGAMLPMEKVWEARADGRYMVCNNCRAPSYFRAVANTWENRDENSLVTFMTPGSTNPMGFEWRQDIDDKRYPFFRMLMKDIDPHQHRRDRRNAIIERGQKYKKKFMKNPLLTWFLPTCKNLSNSEVYSACIVVCSYLTGHAPHRYPEHVIDMAKKMYESERNTPPKMADYNDINKEFLESLEIKDLYEIP